MTNPDSPSVATETVELEKMLIKHERLCMEDLRAAFGAEDASRAIEPVTSRILASRKAILVASRSPTASPDQDFLKLLDAWQQSVEEASRILRANHVSLPARDEILRVRTERRQSLVDYLEGIRAERDRLRAELMHLKLESARERVAPLVEEAKLAASKERRL